MRSRWRSVLDWRSTSTIWSWLAVFCMGCGFGVIAGRGGLIDALQAFLLMTVGNWIFSAIHGRAIAGDGD
jgi:hypothetical protein